MPAATVDYQAMLAHVERVKKAWRETERSKSWEEKIEAIVRMRERDKAIERTRNASIQKLQRAP
jgi:hypothetical protein